MSEQHHSKYAAEVEKYIKQKMDNINAHNFDQQLKEQIHRRIARQQKIMINHLKRQIAQQKSIKAVEERKSKIHTDLMAKLENSEQKRTKKSKEKMESIKRQRQYRNELFQERLHLLQQQERQSRIQKLKKYNKKIALNPETPIKNENIKLQEEPHYQKMKKIYEQDYEEKKKKAQHRKAFQKVSFKSRERRHSTGDLHKNLKLEQLQKQKINKMGQHLTKIQVCRKQKQKLLQERIKKSQSLQNYAMEQQQQRLRQIQKQQSQKRQILLKKLMVQTPSQSNFSQHKNSKVRISDNFYSQYSVVEDSEMNEDKQKINYRREIQKYMNQYFQKQKISEKRQFLH